jgi:Flp pilus assembly pilin Flp
MRRMLKPVPTSVFLAKGSANTREKQASCCRHQSNSETHEQQSLESIIYRDVSAMKPLRIIRRFCRSEDGVTSVEYLVMVAMIVIAAIYGITATGAGAGGWWGKIGSDLGTHGF